jgi:hypothetical protein
MDASGQTVASYAELITLLRAHIAELNVPYDTVDQVAGWPTRYLSKIVGKRPPKCLGPRSMFELLKALGSRMTISVDADALARLRLRADW